MKIILVFFYILITTFRETESHLIVGGSETPVEYFPFIASLQIRIGRIKLHFCGATILSNKYLLSAAHCDPGILLALLYARVGSDFYKEGGVLVKVASFKTHPDYNKQNLSNDIAVLGLHEGFQLSFGYGIEPVTLAVISDVYPTVGQTATIVGWGIERMNSSSASSKLKSADISMIDQEICSNNFENFNISKMLCGVNTRNTPAGACFGDSGGPLLLDEIQIGIISGGSSCDQSNIPGVYTKISYFRKWITEVSDSK